MNLNKVILIGNLTKQPELKALPNGVKVVSFGIATNRNWKDKDGKKQEEVEFHNVVAFGKTAETLATYCVKGQNIMLEGRLKTQTWEKDGHKNYRTEVIIETFQFGAKPKSDTSESKPINETSTLSQEDVDTIKATKESYGIDCDEINPADIPF